MFINCFDAHFLPNIYAILTQSFGKRNSHAISYLYYLAFLVKCLMELHAALKFLCVFFRKRCKSTRRAYKRSCWYVLYLRLLLLKDRSTVTF